MPEEHTADDEWRCMVPIRSGKGRRPFFCVHAVGGNVLNYSPLVRCLPPEQAFYGIQSRGLDGAATPFDNLPDMVAQVTSFLKMCRQSVKRKEPVQLEVVRMKNGFAAVRGIPQRYTDVKVNVAVRVEGEAVVGEVQFLLKPVLEAKLRAHELYELERSLPMWRGASARAVQLDDLKRQLQLTGGVAKRVAPLMVARADCFVVDQHDNPACTKVFENVGDVCECHRRTMLAEPPAHRPARPAHPARQSAGEASTRSAGGAESST